jgi:hypothetical protein
MRDSRVTPNQSDTEFQAELLGITPNSRIPAELSRLFILVILMAIPLLYRFGYIEILWLNRIGIILNFCAGFMLAPELLGTKRLLVIEAKTKHFLSRMKQFVKGYRDFLPMWRFFLPMLLLLLFSYTMVLISKRSGNNSLPNYLTTIAPIAIAISGFLASGIILAFVILLSVDYLSMKLAGDERLRYVLIWWGIIFFIVGNLLQFIATF